VNIPQDDISGDAGRRSAAVETQRAGHQHDTDATTAYAPSIAAAAASWKNHPSLIVFWFRELLMMLDATRLPPQRGHYPCNSQPGFLGATL
jgi:hypothetical protein